MEGLSGRGRDWVLGARGWVLGEEEGKIANTHERSPATSSSPTATAGGQGAPDGKASDVGLGVSGVSRVGASGNKA